MKTARAVAILGLLFATGCGERACGGRGGLAPSPLPMVKDPDGRTYYLLDRGEYKGYYSGDGRMDRWQVWQKGRLASEELDTKGTGKPDRRLVYGAAGNILRVERVTP